MNPKEEFQDGDRNHNCCQIISNVEPVDTKQSPQVWNRNLLQQSSRNLDNVRVDDDNCEEFARASAVFRSSFAQKTRKYGDLMVLDPDSLEIIPSNVEKDEIRDLVASAKKRKARSSEMVRVSDLGVEDQKFFRSLVRKTRMIYDSLRAFFSQEEENRARADLKAATLMKERDLWLNRDKRIIGSIPGVYIGDQFFFRMELCVLGLHGQMQAGIDYISAGQSVCREPIATSIVLSGGYEDDEDRGDVIIYTGHGGKMRCLNKQVLHQKLEGGNLALERSRHYEIEIRVMRAIKCERSPSGRVFVYDGLYKIINCWCDVGKSGFSVYKYQLLRIPGQAEMGSSIVKFTENLKANPSSLPVGYVSIDISKGREGVPIFLFNDVDNDQSPLSFEYFKSTIYPKDICPLGNGKDDGCDCVSGCVNGCSCLVKNGGEFAYDGNGILLRGKPLVHECGIFCKCPTNCRNRVSQKGLKIRLEVFRSRETGWGVRTLETIPAGSFICEYTGVIREFSKNISTNYESLIHPKWFSDRWADWGNLSDVFPEYVPPTFPPSPSLNFALDVSTTRNVACYFSHSCTPNVFVQFVLYSQYDPFPRLMLFAMENIPPLRELSIDYGVDDGPKELLAICN